MYKEWTKRIKIHSFLLSGHRKRAVYAKGYPDSPKSMHGKIK